MPENMPAVLIPAFQPDEKLVTLVRELHRRKLPVLVVNDGSVGCEAVFAAIQPLCQVVGYKENLGKGYALKLGLKLLQEQGYSTAVTADADGQHAPDDIEKLCRYAQGHDNTLVLGVRRVQDMPLRSRWGNSLTRLLFRLLYRVNITDTQTGLRAIPLQNVEALCALSGDRYEYEMNLLVESGRLFDAVEEIPIQTIYIDNNESSHFHPLRDGLRIYRVLLKNTGGFLLSSLSAAAIDFLIYTMLFFAFGRTAVVSVIAARVISSSYNYLINKYVVFRTASKGYNPARYFMLAVSLLAANSCILFVFVDQLHFSAVFTKIIVEVVLWSVSYGVQSRWSNASGDKEPLR